MFVANLLCMEFRLGLAAWPWKRHRQTDRVIRIYNISMDSNCSVITLNQGYYFINALLCLKF